MRGPSEQPETLPPPSLPPYLPAPPSPSAPPASLNQMAWLPATLARPSLTAQLLVSAVLQFIVATAALIVTLYALLIGLASGIGAVTLALPLGLCLVHAACGVFALRRQSWALWVGYVFLAIEAMFVLAYAFA